MSLWLSTVWSGLSHWSGFRRRCLCPGWIAWTPYTCVGDKGKWGNFARFEVNCQKTRAPGSVCPQPPQFSANRLWWLTSLCTSAMSYTCQHSTPDIVRCSGITGAAMQSLDNHFWKSRISIPTKLKLYNTCLLRIFLHRSECRAVTLHVWMMMHIPEWS